MENDKWKMGNPNSQGYIALLTVLVVMAVILATSATVSLLGISEAQSSLALAKGEKTLVFVEACVEEVLQKARADSSYNGGILTLPEGTCTVTINSKVGITWDFDVTTNATDYKRTINIIIDRNPTKIILKSWREK